MPLLVGTSGWQYRDWRGAFYPDRLPVAPWLEHYATRFPTVENNGTFYRLAAPETFAAWRARTPAGFVMAIKASRYLTHMRRLREPAEPVARLLGAAAGLGDRLGPVLVQLPPTMQADPGALEECLRQFAAQSAALGVGGSGGLRVCVEFRHPSWETHEVQQILAQTTTPHCAGRIAAAGPSDRCGARLTGVTCACTRGPRSRGRATDGKPCAPGSPESRSSFPPEADVFAYFNNDQHGAAPADAETLVKLADRAGWPVTLPASGEAPAHDRCGRPPGAAAVLTSAH